MYIFSLASDSNIPVLSNMIKQENSTQAAIPTVTKESNNNVPEFSKVIKEIMQPEMSPVTVSNINRNEDAVSVPVAYIKQAEPLFKLMVIFF